LQTKLIYRIPNQLIVEIVGVFKKLESPEYFNGFIVSDFEGKNFYGFFDGENGEMYKIQEIPVEINKNIYCETVKKILNYFDEFKIQKTILSRVKNIEFNADNLWNLFYEFSKNYPNAFCYAFDSPMLGKWIGATPEILLNIDKKKGNTISLAGTKSIDDKGNWDNKELNEQKFVTNFIEQKLTKFCENITISERTEFIAGPVKHLINYFNFDIEHKNIWKLVHSIHPTPAVCGFPRKKSLKCISKFETHNRNLYAGIIGVKSKDKIQLFVNIRSAQLIDNNLFIYIGSGLTKDSTPELEWEETENKAKTITNLISKINNNI
jgi:isochorismate synthase